MGLENSIARVLGTADSNMSAGTAFLFAASPGRQLWMSCHHVIRKLPGIHLAVRGSTTQERVPCDYRHDLSSPAADIAVLETAFPDAIVQSLRLRVLPLGSPFSRAPSKSDLVGCGFAKHDAERYPRGFNFHGRFTNPQCLHTSPDTEDESRGIIELGQPWNIPFRDGLDLDLYEFLDEGKGLDRGLSGSPICIEIEERGAAATFMCVGMLHARRLLNGTSTHGLVIPCDTIRASCSEAMPFYNYSDLVIVVLAAKTDEYEALRAMTAMEDLPDRLDHYHPHSRDGWKPFTQSDPAVRDMLASIPLERTWQLSSDYIGRDDQTFMDYLADRVYGPLLYVVDPCSVRADTLSDIVKLASDHNRGAAYVFPLCDTLGTARSNLKETLRQTLGDRLWSAPHSGRRRTSTDPHEFADSIRELADQAWERFTREKSAEPRRRSPGFTTGRAIPRMDWA